jgi:hypothetical protein
VNLTPRYCVSSDISTMMFIILLLVSRKKVMCLTFFFSGFIIRWFEVVDSQASKFYHLSGIEVELPMVLCEVLGHVLPRYQIRSIAEWSFSL